MDALLAAISALDDPAHGRSPEEFVAALCLLAMGRLPKRDHSNWYGDRKKDEALEALYKIANVVYTPPPFVP